MQISGALTGRFRYRSHEGNGFVLSFRLQLSDPPHLKARPPQVFHGLRWYLSRLGPGLCGGDLDLQPELITMLVRPDEAHFGSRVLGDQSLRHSHSMVAGGFEVMS